MIALIEESATIEEVFFKQKLRLLKTGTKGKQIYYEKKVSGIL